MPFFQAIGLGICILVLRFLVPTVLSEAENTAIAFLKGAQVSAQVATDLAASAGDIELSHEPFALPTVSPVRDF